MAVARPVKQTAKNRIQTLSYRTDVMVPPVLSSSFMEEVEFAESRKASGQQGQAPVQQAYAQPQQGYAPQQASAQPQYQQQTFNQAVSDGFMNPDAGSDEGMPFR